MSIIRKLAELLMRISEPDEEKTKAPIETIIGSVKLSITAQTISHGFFKDTISAHLVSAICVFKEREGKRVFELVSSNDPDIPASVIDFLREYCNITNSIVDLWENSEMSLSDIMKRTENYEGVTVEVIGENKFYITA